jgi:two-component system, NtrC family, response regulator HydG
LESSAALSRKVANDRISVLVVDDDRSLTESLAQALRLHKIDVATAGSRAAAQRALAERSFDAVLVDLVLPDGDGIDLLDDRRRSAETEFIVITGHATISTAVEAMKRGARDYVTKPVDPGKLAKDLRVLSRSHALQHELRDGRSQDEGAGALVGSSAAIRSVLEQVARIAPTAASVLIEGERGTGKELVARRIHESSARSRAPFVTMTFGAIDAASAELELFGGERSDESGAEPEPSGLLEKARGGTLFLDEITVMPASTQRRLLRAIETGSFRRFGGTDPIGLDVRLLSSTAFRPAAAVSAGLLRGDLLALLSGFSIRLPTLQERHEDVAPLAAHFLALLNAAHGTNRSWAPGALDDLARRTWGGNVRELKSAVHRAFLLSGDLVEAANALPDPAPSASAAGDAALAVYGPGASIEEVERALILATYDYTKGCKPSAARMLGISLKTLYNKLHAYGVLPR